MTARLGALPYLDARDRRRVLGRGLVGGLRFNAKHPQSLSGRRPYDVKPDRGGVFRLVVVHAIITGASKRDPVHKPPPIMARPRRAVTT
jgi:hypothetical protein